MQKLYLQRSQAVAFSYLKEWKRTTISVLPLTRLSPIRSSISILFCSLTFPLADGPFQSKWERQQSPYIRCHGACSCKAIWDHKNYISWRHLHCTIYPSPVYLQVKCIYCQFFFAQDVFLQFFMFTPLSSYLAPKIAPFATSGFRKCKSYYVPQILLPKNNCFSINATNWIFIPILQLALSYRLLDHLGLNEGACNHLSIIAPARNGKQGEEVMLLGPGTM